MIQGLLMALPAIASAGASIYGASKTPKTSTATTKALMTPEQRRMLRLTTALAASRLAGVPMPEEQKEINSAVSAGNVATRNAITGLQESGVQGGAKESMVRSLLEANIANRMGTVPAIQKQHYDEAYNAGMQIGLRGPQAGQKTTVPQSGAAAMGEAGSSLGSITAMLPYLMKANPAASPAAPAATPTATPGVPQAGIWDFLRKRYAGAPGQVTT